MVRLCLTISFAKSCQTCSFKKTCMSDGGYKIRNQCVVHLNSHAGSAAQKAGQ